MSFAFFTANKYPAVSLCRTRLVSIGICLMMQGCGSTSKPESTTPFLGEDSTTTKATPHNPLLDGAFPTLRQDTFYTTYIEEGGKTSTLHDRFVANGKGFVAYCEEAGFDNGYYLYNFYGHTSYFIQIKNQTYKTAMTSPGDDLIVSYQQENVKPGGKLAPGYAPVTALPSQVVNEIACNGISYTRDGVKHEDWFDAKSGRLVDQTIEHGGRIIKRHLQRFNKDCDTMLLRLPQGYTLEK